MTPQEGIRGSSDGTAGTGPRTTGRMMTTTTTMRRSRWTDAQDDEAEEYDDELVDPDRWIGEGLPSSNPTPHTSAGKSTSSSPGILKTTHLTSSTGRTAISGPRNPHTVEWETRFNAVTRTPPPPRHRTILTVPDTPSSTIPRHNDAFPPNAGSSGTNDDQYHGDGIDPRWLVVPDCALLPEDMSEVSIQSARIKGGSAPPPPPAAAAAAAGNPPATNQEYEFFHRQHAARRMTTEPTDTILEDEASASSSSSPPPSPVVALNEGGPHDWSTDANQHQHHSKTGRGNHNDSTRRSSGKKTPSDRRQRPMLLCYQGSGPLDRRYWQTYDPATASVISILKQKPDEATNLLSRKGQEQPRTMGKNERLRKVLVSFISGDVTLRLEASPVYPPVPDELLWWTRGELLDRQEEDRYEVQSNPQAQIFVQECDAIYNAIFAKVQTFYNDRSKGPIKEYGALNYTSAKLRRYLSKTFLYGLALGYRGLEFDGGLQGRRDRTVLAVEAVRDYYLDSSDRKKQASRRLRLNFTNGLALAVEEVSVTDRFWARVVALGEEVLEEKATYGTEFEI